MSTTFTAPYVPPTQDNINNGTTVIINIREATYIVGEREYDPAPSKLALVTVYPEGVDFLSVTMSADPDVIDPDVEEDGTTFGFTVVDVEVKLHTDANPSGDPASGIDVYVTVSPAVPEISPASATTDANGRAQFTLTSTDLPEDDGSQNEFLISVDAVHLTDTNIKAGEQILRVYIIDWEPPVEPGTPFPTFLVIASLFCVGAVSYGVIRRIKK